MYVSIINVVSCCLLQSAMFSANAVLSGLCQLSRPKNSIMHGRLHLPSPEMNITQKDNYYVVIVSHPKDIDLQPVGKVGQTNCPIADAQDLLNLSAPPSCKRQ